MFLRTYANLGLYPPEEASASIVRRKGRETILNNHASIAAWQARIRQEVFSQMEIQWIYILDQVYFCRLFIDSLRKRLDNKTSNYAHLRPEILSYGMRLNNAFAIFSQDFTADSVIPRGNYQNVDRLLRQFDRFLSGFPREITEGIFQEVVQNMDKVKKFIPLLFRAYNLKRKWREENERLNHLLGLLLGILGGDFDGSKAKKYMGLEDIELDRLEGLLRQCEQEAYRSSLTRD